MKTQRPSSSRFVALIQRRLRASMPIAAAFAATLVSLPSAAVSIPNTPLQSGASFPAPNIMLILDDSGSMERVYMPDNLSSVGSPSIRDTAYPHNPLAYNSAVTYKAWIKADNTRYTTGTSYTSVWSDLSNLSSSDDLSDSTQTFYMRKGSSTPLTSYSSYYRYQILTNGRMVRAEYKNTTPAPAASTVTVWLISFSSTSRFICLERSSVIPPRVASIPRVTEDPPPYT